MIFLLFSVFPMILVPTSLSIAATSLSHYEATFEIIPDSRGDFRDVKTELKVTYRIDGGLKTGGMKFIEAPSIDAVQVTDGEGKPLRFKVSRSGKRYSRINWYFPGISEGE